MKSYLKIIRPFNCIFIGFAVIVGSVLDKLGVIRTQMFYILLMSLSAMLIAAGGYVVNDYYDLSVDRVNKPRRILPSGRMRPERAYSYSLVLFTIGICLSFTTGQIEIILIAIINSLLLYYYAKKLKNSVLIGNIMISWTTASTFLYGALLTDNLKVILPILVYTFLYTLTRELIKDAEDRDGDLKLGIKTLATVAGRKAAVYVSLVPVLMLIVLLVWNYVHYDMSAVLFYTVLVMFVVPLIFIYVMVIKEFADRKIRFAAFFSKVHMLALLVTYVWLH